MGLGGGISGNSLSRLNLGLSLGLAEGGEFQKAMRLLVISAWAGRQEGLLISASCAIIPESWSFLQQNVRTGSNQTQATVWPPRPWAPLHAGSGASDEPFPPLQQLNKVGACISCEVGGD